VKIRITNRRETQFSLDIENSFGEMIRQLVPPGETIEVDEIDPFYINQDKDHLRNSIFAEQDLDWEFVCEPDDLVCFTGWANFGDTRPALKGSILVGDGFRWQRHGPGPDGDVLVWDSTQPLGVRFDTIAGAATGLIDFGADSVGSSPTDRYLYTSYAERIAETSPHFWTAPRAGTLKNLFVRHGAPKGNGNNIIYRVRVNTVATALLVTLASTAPLGSDTTNTVAVAQGDRVDLQVVKTLNIGASPRNVVATLEVA
jgi:hypothetical protein